MREETEWVETVDSGWNYLAGADREKIKKGFDSFKPDVKRPHIYGSGDAADKIVHIIRSS